MSNRQLKRVKKLLDSKSNEDTNSEAEEQTEMIQITENNYNSKFGTFELSDSESTSESEEDTEIELLPKNTMKKKKPIILNSSKTKSEINFISEFEPMERNKWLDILVINGHYLNEETERRGAFQEEGKAVMKNSHKHHKLNSRKSIRTFYFLVPQDDWPSPPTHISNGFGMEIDDDPTIIRENNCTYYKFIYSKLYRDLDNQLTDITATNNFSDLQAFSSLNIYHVDSQLLMSDLLLGNNQIVESYNLLKRVLFVFECSIHPKFNVSSNNNRLLYCKDDNQFFFKALFKYLQSLWRRGYSKTALNVGNFVLSLDPAEDPMGIIHIIDFFSTSSGNYQFLINFFNSDLSIKNINIQSYPNILYGYAICLFQLHQENADEVLQTAILKFPQAVPLLLKETNTINKDISDIPYLNQPFVNSDIEKLVGLMVKRMKDIWKSDILINWLCSNCTPFISKEIDDTTNAELISIFGIDPPPFTSLNPSDYLDSIPRIGLEWFANENRQNHPPIIGNVDPHSNLFEIFLRTLLPWNYLDEDGN